MIAAAGLGSRLGHGLPKCMLEINRRTILSRQIEVIQPHTDRIHVVVGYREELVAEYCAKHHRDVVLVRNPDFRTNSTLSSLRMGARGLSGRVLFTDGDMIIHPRSLDAFVAQGSREGATTLGVTTATSDDAVFVELEESSTGSQVVGFQRTPRLDQEWANIMITSPATLPEEDGFVFEAITPLLPLDCRSVQVAEVDTEEDLERAVAAANSWDAELRNT